MTQWKNESRKKVLMSKVAAWMELKLFDIQSQRENREHKREGKRAQLVLYFIFQLSCSRKWLCKAPILYAVLYSSLLAVVKMLVLLIRITHIICIYIHKFFSLYISFWSSLNL